MKKVVISIAVLAVLGAAAYLFLSRGEKPPEFRTEKVARGSIEAAVTASGTVNAVTTVLVGTQVSGTIKKIHADFNSPVVKGQVIAEIDPATFEAQVEQARANLLAARANLEKSRAALIDAERTFKRNGELYSRGLIARSELDTAETAHEAARAQAGVSGAQVAQAEAALRIAETNLGYTRIVSPVDGIVVSRNVDAGQTVAASFQTPTLFTIAQDLTKMQVNTSVAEADIGAVKQGQPVTFTVDAYPDIEFEGAVSEVRNAPVIIQNVVTYDVIVKVGNPELKLKPGMTANASITVAQKAGVLMVPNAALRFRMPQAKGAEKGPGVWALRGGKPERVPVRTGISDGVKTELVSGDLAEGQEVIVEAAAKKAGNGNGNRGRTGPRMF